MLKAGKLCQPLSSIKEKYWPYHQYYVGDKDEDGRKDSKGENHWSGAKSLEWYEGDLARDTMHGIGNYYWRFLGVDNAFITYEGYFYCNRLHGYGTMSYSDGQTFNGLFQNNERWGPGIEHHADSCEDVGLWRGLQLLRLVWQPSAPNIIPDFMTIPTGRAIVESQRVVLTSKAQTINEVSTATELLEQYGADPRIADARWSKVFSKYCTDVASPLCHVDHWNQIYYNGKINTLEEMDRIGDCKDIDYEAIETYYAWNNNKIIIDMMNHSYRHEKQTNFSLLDLKSILSGLRDNFKRAGIHEIRCRTMLMACYLGYKADVAQFVNEHNINPSVCDGHGNSAIMYAVCGDQPEIIHFLVEAGANVDMYNDNCCTPLAVALIRYTCGRNDIAPNAMLQALLPPPIIPTPALTERQIYEWNIIRDQSSSSTGGTINKNPSKTARNISSKKIKSLISIKDHPLSKRKSDPIQIKTSIPEDEPILYDTKVYNEISSEYCATVTNTFNHVNTTAVVPYLFHVYDIAKEIEASEEDQRKTPEKVPKKVTSKLMRETAKQSKDALWENKEKEMQIIDDFQTQKLNKLSKIMITILQLLLDGANPKFVRCPQPALFIAISSNDHTLMQHLIQYGADVNEVYNHLFNYSPLDLVICRPFTRENFEMAKVLLEFGADAGHRLNFNQDTKDQTSTDIKEPGPTLLHVVLSRRTDNENEEDIRLQLLNLLLEYECSATAQFKGRSAMDVAMNKSMEILNVFLKSPKIDLNAVINEANQRVLVKIFSIHFFRNMSSTERIQMITNVLLYGADPLLKCQNGNDIFENIFVFAKQSLIEMESSHTKPTTSSQTSKPDPNGKKPDKPKKEEKLLTKSVAKMSVDEVEDYKQAVDLMTDCARLIYTRWLQAKLMKEVVQIINRFRHRHWNMILKEIRDNKNWLWLTPQRCLEIWNILSTTKNKIYTDKRILRHLLSTAIFMSWRNYGHDKLIDHTLTAPLKDAIESDVTNLLRRNDEKIKNTSKCDFIDSSNFLFVKPELGKNAKKYNVCFECMQPLLENTIACSWCKIVSFCSNECIKSNINRENCHPCNDFLRIMYISSQEIAANSGKI